MWISWSPVVLSLLASVSGTPVQVVNYVDVPAVALPPASRMHLHEPRKLQGRFLHITDLHPDPFYKVHSSTEEASACHRGSGSAGYYGAETTDCDSPLTLIDETFRWIETHLRDSIDFVVWTGDSARHSNDDEILRTAEQVLDENTFLANKFAELFGDGTASGVGGHVPVVPTFGNNDVSPHNQLAPGPNRWTKAYSHIWDMFIPVAQRRDFRRGGWFYVEVIPGRLAVFSLNTMYFFQSNEQVDGCASSSEPGHAHLKWLRRQLKKLRERGVKAIFIGHVPPARTEAKMSWYESCWHEYMFLAQEYRDLIVGSMFGHMNIDHFMLHDSDEIDRSAVEADSGDARGVRESESAADGLVSIKSAAQYLVDLRQAWAQLPRPSRNSSTSEDNGPVETAKKREKHRSKSYIDEIGGEWAERYAVSLVSPSLIPNYFPTLRVFEYNLTGLDLHSSVDAPSEPVGRAVSGEQQVMVDAHARPWTSSAVSTPAATAVGGDRGSTSMTSDSTIDCHTLSKSRPPGPAYSPQTLTLLGYTQYFANLTDLNNDFVSASPGDDGADASRWHSGKHRERPLPQGEARRRPKKLDFEVEYRTQDDDVFGLRDLTVSSYLQLARRIGEYCHGGKCGVSHPETCTRAEFEAEEKPLEEEDAELDGNREEKRDEDDTRLSVSKGRKNKHHRNKKHKNKKHKNKKHKSHKVGPREREVNEAWFTFVKRAFVGTKDDDELRDEFGVSPLVSSCPCSSSRTEESCVRRRR